jgi:hypothetical protein
MKLLSVVSLLGLVLAPCRAAEPAPAPPLTDAQQKTRDALSEEGSSAGLTVAAVLAGEKRSPGMLYKNETDAVYAYSVCRAVSGVPDACAALKSISRNEESKYYTRCRTLSVLAAMTQASLKGGDALAPCRQLIDEVLAMSLTAKGRDDVCSAYTHAIAANRFSCDEFVKKGLAPFDRPEECQRAGIFLQADPEACSREGAKSGDKHSGWVEECRLQAQIVASVKGRAGLCSSSPSCVALSKGAAACDQLGKDFLAQFQAGYSRKKQEQARWDKKRGDDEFKRKADELAKFKKVQADRLAAQEKQRKDQERADKEKKAREEEAASQRQFKDNEPMQGPLVQPPPGAQSSAAPTVPPNALPPVPKSEAPQ